MDLLHAYTCCHNYDLLIECHTCYMYCTEASAPLVLHSFCPYAELRVGRKLSAGTCNTCSTRCCLGIELIDFWFQSFVTLNGIAGLAQHCGTSLKIKLSTMSSSQLVRQFCTQGSTVSAEKSIVLSLSSGCSSKLHSQALQSVSAPNSLIQAPIISVQYSPYRDSQQMVCFEP